MKNLFSVLAIITFLGASFTSCNKDDFDYDKSIQDSKKQEEKLDSIFTSQKSLIENYVQTNFGPTAKEDTIKYYYTYLDKSIKRGLWYEILSEPTSNTFEYKGQVVSSYYGSYYTAILPKVKLKYTAKLLNGTVVASDIVGTPYDLATLPSTTLNKAWEFAFVPYSIQYNGKAQVTYGLTKDGLKQGSKIRVITPSPWAFGGTASEKIPANSILIYEFEVLEINY